MAKEKENIAEVIANLQKSFQDFANIIGTTNNVVEDLNTVLSEDIDLFMKSKDKFESLTEAQEESIKFLKENKKNIEELTDITKEEQWAMLQMIDMYEKSTPVIKNLSEEEKKLEKNIRVLNKGFKILREETLKETKTIVKHRVESTKKIGGKYFGAFMEQFVYGAEGTKKRENMERGLAAEKQPKLFPGEGPSGFAKILGSTFSKIESTFTKIAPFLTILGGIFAKLLELFNELQGIAPDLVKNTGASLMNISGMAGQILLIGPELKGVGMSMEQAAKTAGSLAEHFRNLSLFSIASVETITYLSERTGIAADNMARFYKVLNMTSGISEKTFRKLTVRLKATVDTLKLSFSGVMKEVVANAEELHTWFKGSYEYLTRAVIRAQMLGISLGDQTKMAEGFSTWADAVDRTFKISTMTGKSLNAASLYVDAALGGAEGMQRVTKTIVKNLADTQSRWKDSLPLVRELSKALGVSANEMMTMVENSRIETLTGITDPIGIAALREIAKDLGKTPQEIAESYKDYKKEISNKEKELKLQEASLKKTYGGMIDSGKEFAEAIGVKEQMTLTEQILATIAALVQKIFLVLYKFVDQWTFGGLSEAIGIASPFEKKEMEQKYGKDIIEKGQERLRNSGEIETTRKLERVVANIRQEDTTAEANAMVRTKENPTPSLEEVNKQRYKNIAMKNLNANGQWKFNKFELDQEVGKVASEEFQQAVQQHKDNMWNWTRDNVWNPIKGLAGFDEGGMATQASIFGEKGPEFAAPMTGPGVKKSTVPFLSSMFEPIANKLFDDTPKNEKLDVQELASAIGDIISQQLQKLSDRPIQVSVYLDSDTIAEKIEKRNIRVAMR